MRWLCSWYEAFHWICIFPDVQLASLCCVFTEPVWDLLFPCFYIHALKHLLWGTLLLLLSPCPTKVFSNAPQMPFTVTMYTYLPYVLLEFQPGHPEPHWWRQMSPDWNLYLWHMYFTSSCHICLVCDQVMYNLHVVFTMNPSSEGLKDRAATSPALFNRCVLNWFGDWSNEALYQVGKEFTNKMDLEKSNVSEEFIGTVLSY